MNAPAYLFLMILFSFTLFVHGQSPVRKKIILDDNWKFKLGHAANPEKDFNYSVSTIFSKSGGAFNTAIDPRFRDSAWRTLDLPLEIVKCLRYQPMLVSGNNPPTGL